MYLFMCIKRGKPLTAFFQAFPRDLLCSFLFLFLLFFNPDRIFKCTIFWLKIVCIVVGWWDHINRKNSLFNASLTMPQETIRISFVCGLWNGNNSIIHRCYFSLPSTPLICLWIVLWFYRRSIIQFNPEICSISLFGFWSLTFEDYHCSLQYQIEFPIHLTTLINLTMEKGAFNSIKCKRYKIK